jgi:predicted nucleotidyltransferase
MTEVKSAVKTAENIWKAKEVESMLGIRKNTEDVYSIDEIKTRVTPVLRANHVSKAILFGSYASGTAKAKSDIDLLVESGMRGLAFCGLTYDIEVALEKDADIYETIYIPADSPILREVNKTGMMIYER